MRLAFPAHWLAGSLLAGLMTPAAVAESPPDAATLNSPGAVMVHLFEWRWDDVARECERVLGPAGITAVQVSPPNEHIALDPVDGAWWARYQPVSYRLDSRSGDRAAFADMVTRCRAAGVGVVVDAVINHMAGIGEGEGIAGTRYTPFQYGDLYRHDDFHHCGRHDDDNIRNYQDRWEVQHCHLVGLADLATEKPAVRERIRHYLQTLLDLGVAGFRIDAAKHIPPEDIAAILEGLDGLDGAPYIVQEVIDMGNEPITVQDYLANGDVTEFRYGPRLSRAFMSGDLARLHDLGDAPGWAPAERALVFIDNHDTQRGHGAGGTVMTSGSGKRYTLGRLFMLAWPYGTPRLMSSYTFENADQGPPHHDDGWQTLPVYHGHDDRCGDSRWVCEHRDPAVLAMVGFRRAVGAAPVRHWQTDGESRIAFSRGARGFIAFNRSETAWTATLTTGLAPGEYCDILAACRETIRVDENGRARLTVPADGAVALRHDR